MRMSVFPICGHCAIHDVSDTQGMRVSQISAAAKSLRPSRQELFCRGVLQGASILLCIGGEIHGY